MIDSVNQFCIKNLCHVVCQEQKSLLNAMVELQHQLTGDSIQEGSSSATILGSLLGSGLVFRTPALSRVERSQQLDRLMKSGGYEYTIIEWKDHYSEMEG